MKMLLSFCCASACWLLACPSAPAQELAPHTELRVKTTTEISSRLNHKGDKISVFVTSPPNFQGATVEGEVRNAHSGGAVNKTSQLDLVFSTLILPDQRQIRVSSQIKQMINSKGQANVDEEGQIVEHKGNTGKVVLGTVLGAAIGAAVGGGRGAAIGAGAGAATSLIMVSVFVKGPSITFLPGSEFVLEVGPNR